VLAAPPLAAVSSIAHVNQPIRVLELLVTTSPGGGPKHVWDLVQHLPRSEFELVIGAPRDGIFFDRFRDRGLEVVEFPLSRLGARHFHLTRRLISRLRIDVVHTHGTGPGCYGRLAARWVRVPAIHTFHGPHDNGSPPLSRHLSVALERQLARWSHTIINGSRSQHLEGLGLRLFRPEQGVVIVNGVDIEDMERVLLESPIRRESLGLTAADVVIGCVSRFDPLQRIELLVEALRRLRARFPRLVLVLVGGGGEQPRIRRLVFEGGVAAQVIFTGFLESPARIQPVLDLYVASSRKEGLPPSILEAMAAGLAVVATDVPGHRDVVVPGETGLLVTPEDPAALADAIAALLTDPARRKSLGQAGRERVRQDFSIRAMVDATAAAYRRAARR
jgi:glycosyltransferase involved in cell wall biosynthesis